MRSAQLNRDAQHLSLERDRRCRCTHRPEHQRRDGRYGRDCMEIHESSSGSSKYTASAVPYWSDWCYGHPESLHLVFHVDRDDLVERALSHETECLRTSGFKTLRPGRDDLCHCGVRLTFDERECRIAGDTLQRGQLVPHCCREAGHCQCASATQGAGVNVGRVNQETYGGTRAREPGPHVLIHGKHRLLAIQWLPQNAGIEARGCAIRFTWSNADCRQPDTHPVNESATAVVGQQQLNHGFLSAVARKRGRHEGIRNRLGKGAAKHRQGGSKHQSGDMALLANRFEQRARAVEVDTVTFVEIRLSLTRNNGGEVEYHLGSRSHQLGSRT